MLPLSGCPSNDECQSGHCVSHDAESGLDGWECDCDTGFTGELSNCQNNAFRMSCLVPIWLIPVVAFLTIFKQLLGDQICADLKCLIFYSFKLYGYFNIHINRSGSDGNNHVCDALFSPRLGDDLLSTSLRFFNMPLGIQWYRNTIVVIIWVNREVLHCVFTPTMYPPSWD